MIPAQKLPHCMPSSPKKTALWQKWAWRITARGLPKKTLPPLLKSRPRTRLFSASHLPNLKHLAQVGEVDFVVAHGFAGAVGELGDGAVVAAGQFNHNRQRREA